MKEQVGAWFTGMHPYDAFALAFVAYHALMGLLRGGAFQLLRLTSWLAAILLARRFAPELAERIRALDPGIGTPADTILAWSAILIATLVVGLVVLRLIKRLIASWKLGALDRLVGLIVGLAKGALIVVLVTLALFRLAAYFAFEDALAASKTAAFTASVVDGGDIAFPSDIATGYRTWFAAALARAGDPK